MIELAKGADYAKAQKSNKLRKIIIAAVVSVFTVLIFSTGYMLYKYDNVGVTINDCHIKLHELSKYKSIVEPTLKPVVFTTDNDLLTEGFTCHITDPYVFDYHQIGQSLNLAYNYTFNENILKKNLQSINDQAIKSQDAYIDPNTKTIVSEIYGTECDIDSVVAAINGLDIINLADYYIEPNRVSNDLEEFVEAYNNWMKWSVSYKDSDIVVKAVDGALTIDRDGNISVASTDFINNSMVLISDFYDTKGKDYIFVTNAGSEIVVPGGTLGSKIDSDKELEELIELFTSNKSVQDKEPNYVTHREITTEYIEVSLDDQHAWYYKDGEILWESDCVTGCVSNGHSTTRGAWYLDIVMNGKTLYPDGPSKPGTWVDKWMRFTPTGIGLHDASWRSRFGGTIYKTNGSHGCVNLPVKAAYSLFEHAYIGLPVIVY